MNYSDKQETDPELVDNLLSELKKKYSLTGQSLTDNLEGLLHANYLKYWNYVHLDTLLSLQNPRTDFPDEMIFIVYHQVTELYFKLILSEIEQIATEENITADFFITKLKRINLFFQILTFSYDTMIEGMDVKQFRQFRMALLPASGFQSAQIRKIEIWATDFINLVNKKHKSSFAPNDEISDMFQYIYWKAGATDDTTGEETITSKHFQEKYKTDFILLGEATRTNNLWQIYLKLVPQPATTDTQKEQMKEALRKFDTLMNVDWRLAHFKSAVRYLKNGDGTIDATGGTNWQKYLPPRFQKVIFYPELWAEDEINEWGKKWVDKQ
ncbi:tryptophan 2,3-dioxygenase family protein [uncultured Microscilla sp.]|uniref:tryptophan 2,3-dioxygenase family protein n=1 Tax=uncultured Microscilla sp. TaxID=432653 RepID=UPI002601B62E|nr:tryptophan 2,3-dioxygenase family protein [uncultured Microscilla sp.]